MKATRRGREGGRVFDDASLADKRVDGYFTTGTPEYELAAFATGT